MENLNQQKNTPPQKKYYKNNRNKNRQGNKAENQQPLPALNDNVIVLNLTSPIVWGGKEIKEIKLDKSKLNMAVIFTAETEYRSKNPGQLSMLEFSPQYCFWVASVLTEIEFGALLKLDFNDGMMLFRCVQYFLTHGK